MKLQEVEDLYFQYEDIKHDFLQKTQKYFLERGFQPYVWLDEIHRLRVKQKYPRTVHDFKPNKERDEFLLVAKQFAKKNNLTIRFVQELGEIDKLLPQDVQELWSTEIIFEV